MLIKYYDGQLVDADAPNVVDEATEFKAAKE
jgi:hypothetical protein